MSSRLRFYRDRICGRITAPAESFFRHQPPCVGAAGGGTYTGYLGGSDRAGDSLGCGIRNIGQGNRKCRFACIHLQFCTAAFHRVGAGLDTVINS